MLTGSQYATVADNNNQLCFILSDLSWFPNIITTVH